MKHYKLTPLDTLFFRGGQPFNAGETGQMEIAGHFPPAPATVVGAMRAALARNNGWDEKKEKHWSECIKKVLGDGDALADLRFHGPYLLKNKELLFPAPLHLLGKATKDNKSTWSDFLRLAPVSEKDSLATDIGLVRLVKPTSKTDGHKTLENCYLTLAGIKNVLEGALPEAKDVIQQKALWQTENRVGIQRDYASKTTKDNALYQTAHVRLAKDVALAISIDGLPNDWEPQNPAPLGGESRQTWIDTLEALSLPEMPELQPINDKVHYTATLITPAKLTGDGWKTPHCKIEGLAGTVVSACIGKPILIGGWDSLKKEPKALEPFLPAGSTFFMEANISELDTIKSQHGKHIGNKTNWGYGQILIGRW